MGSYEPSIIVHKVNCRDRSITPLHFLFGLGLCAVTPVVHSALEIELMDRLGAEGGVDGRSSTTDSAQPVPECILTLRHPNPQRADADVHCLVGFRNGMLGEFLFNDSSIRCLSSRFIGMVPVGLAEVVGDLVLAISDRAFLLSQMKGNRHLVASPLDFPAGCVVAAAVFLDPSSGRAASTVDASKDQHGGTGGEAAPGHGTGLPLLACCDRDGNLRLLSLKEPPAVHRLHCTPQSITAVPQLGKLLLVCSSAPRGSAPVFELRLFDPQSQLTEASFALPAGVMVTSTCLWPLGTGAELAAGDHRSNDWLKTAFGSPICEVQEDSEGLSTSSGDFVALAAPPQIERAASGESRPGQHGSASGESSSIHTCLSAVKGVAAALTCCTFNRPANDNSPCGSPREFLGSWSESRNQEVFVVVGTRCGGQFSVYSHN